MTENLAVTVLPTPLAAQLLATPLASAANAPRLIEFHGAFTPHGFDAPAQETAALARGAAAHDLGWMRRVNVRGEDRFRWLSGMVTNTVNDLPANGGAWNLVLNAQGRIQGDLTVWREGETLDLVIAADQYEKLMAHFDHFIIMDDVELVVGRSHDRNDRWLNRAAVRRGSCAHGLDGAAHPDDLAARRVERA